PLAESPPRLARKGPSLFCSSPDYDGRDFRVVMLSECNPRANDGAISSRSHKSLIRKGMRGTERAGGGPAGQARLCNCYKGAVARGEKCVTVGNSRMRPGRNPQDGPGGRPLAVGSLNEVPSLVLSAPDLTAPPSPPKQEEPSQGA